MDENDVGSGSGNGAEILKFIKGDAPPTDALLESLRKENWGRHVEIAAFVAQMVRVRYDELMKKGFDSSQALIVTMKWMWP